MSFSVYLTGLLLAAVGAGSVSAQATGKLSSVYLTGLLLAAVGAGSVSAQATGKLSSVYLTGLLLAAVCCLVLYNRCFTLFF